MGKQTTEKEDSANYEPGFLKKLINVSRDHERLKNLLRLKETEEMWKWETMIKQKCDVKAMVRNPE